MPVQYLKGVGPQRARLLRRLGIRTVRDLLYFPPRRYLDRRQIVPIRRLREGREATVRGRIVNLVYRNLKNRKVLVLVLSDGEDLMEVVFFQSPWLKGVFRMGQELIASGKVYRKRSIKVMYHPEWEVLEGRSGPLRTAGRIIPIYPATEGLKPSGLERLIRTAYELAEPYLHDLVPADLRRKRALLSRRQALKWLHFPETLQQAERARRTLSYEEFFVSQARMRYLRLQHQGEGLPLQAGPLARAFLEHLPFSLTGAQQRVIQEIAADVARRNPMHRLLQGDVGAGKTVVAVYAMLLAVDSGYQAALMAPTEILAEQHFLVLTEYLKPLGLEPVLLIGKQSRQQRALALEQLERGTAPVVVGTHALIQEQVAFKNLALAVVDEQHRFGVAQRMALVKKGTRIPHLLVMTATPIPRTLAITAYGHMDVSYLDEKPPGRKEVYTEWRREREREAVYQRLFQEVQQGRQAYVIAPLIEPSDELPARAATELYEELRKKAPRGVRLGLIHGRMNRDERRKIMQLFRDREFDILVATTVIEVGIDVPTANWMVIEDANRFGLAQLHQLRGRIGRGGDQAYCIMLSPDRVSDEAAARLRILTQTTDGFKIAELDLKLRGPGELLGTRQHGPAEFRIGDLLRDAALIQKVQRDVQALFARDPYLTHPEHRNLLEHLLNTDPDRDFYVG